MQPKIFIIHGNNGYLSSPKRLLHSIAQERAWRCVIAGSVVTSRGRSFPSDWSESILNLSNWPLPWLVLETSCANTAGNISPREMACLQMLLNVCRQHCGYIIVTKMNYGQFLHLSPIIIASLNKDHHLPLYLVCAIFCWPRCNIMFTQDIKNLHHHLLFLKKWGFQKD